MVSSSFAKNTWEDGEAYSEAVPDLTEHCVISDRTFQTRQHTAIKRKSLGNASKKVGQWTPF